MFAFPLIWQKASQEMLQLAELPFKWFLCGDDHILITYVVVTQKFSSKSITGSEICSEGMVSVPLLYWDFSPGFLL